MKKRRQSRESEGRKRPEQLTQPDEENETNSTYVHPAGSQGTMESDETREQSEIDMRILNLNKVDLVERLILEEAILRSVCRCTVFLIQFTVLLAILWVTYPGGTDMLETHQLIMSGLEIGEDNDPETALDMKDLSDVQDYLKEYAQQSKEFNPGSTEFIDDHLARIYLKEPLKGGEIKTYDVDEVDRHPPITVSFTITLWFRTKSHIQTFLKKDRLSGTQTCYDFGPERVVFGGHESPITTTVHSPRAEDMRNGSVQWTESWMLKHMEDGQWHHMAFIAQGYPIITHFAVEFYYDGVSAGMVKIPRPITDCPGGALHIGDTAGKVDIMGVQYFGVPLTETEVNDIMDAGKLLTDIISAGGATLKENSGDEEILSAMKRQDRLAQAVLNDLFEETGLMDRRLAKAILNNLPTGSDGGDSGRRLSDFSEASAERPAPQRGAAYGTLASVGLAEEGPNRSACYFNIINARMLAWFNEIHLEGYTTSILNEGTIDTLPQLLLDLPSCLLSKLTPVDMYENMLYQEGVDTLLGLAEGSCGSQADFDNLDIKVIWLEQLVGYFIAFLKSGEMDDICSRRETEQVCQATCGRLYFPYLTTQTVKEAVAQCVDDSDFRDTIDQGCDWYFVNDGPGCSVFADPFTKQKCALTCDSCDYPAIFFDMLDFQQVRALGLNEWNVFIHIFYPQMPFGGYRTAFDFHDLLYERCRDIIPEGYSADFMDCLMQPSPFLLSRDALLDPRSEFAKSAKTTKDSLSNLLQPPAEFLPFGMGNTAWVKRFQVPVEALDRFAIHAQQESNYEVYPLCASNEDCQQLYSYACAWQPWTSENNPICARKYAVPMYCATACWTGACGDGATLIYPFTPGSYCQPCDGCKNEQFQFDDSSCPSWCAGYNVDDKGMFPWLSNQLATHGSMFFMKEDPRDELYPIPSGTSWDEGSMSLIAWVKNFQYQWIYTKTLVVPGLDNRWEGYDEKTGRLVCWRLGMTGLEFRSRWDQRQLSTEKMPSSFQINFEEWNHIVMQKKNEFRTPLEGGYIQRGYIHTSIEFMVNGKAHREPAGNMVTPPPAFAFPDCGGRLVTTAVSRMEYYEGSSLAHFPPQSWLGEDQVFSITKHGLTAMYFKNIELPSKTRIIKGATLQLCSMKSLVDSFLVQEQMVLAPERRTCEALQFAPPFLSKRTLKIAGLLKPDLLNEFKIGNRCWLTKAIEGQLTTAEVQWEVDPNEWRARGVPQWNYPESGDLPDELLPSTCRQLSPDISKVLQEILKKRKGGWKNQDSIVLLIAEADRPWNECRAETHDVIHPSKNPDYTNLESVHFGMAQMTRGYCPYVWHFSNALADNASLWLMPSRMGVSTDYSYKGVVPNKLEIEYCLNPDCVSPSFIGGGLSAAVGSATLDNRFHYTLSFEPGDMGITYHEYTGAVIQVNPDGQAQSKGVKRGDRIQKVDTLPFSKEAVIAAEGSGLRYKVTFQIHFEPAPILNVEEDVHAEEKGSLVTLVPPATTLAPPESSNNDAEDATVSSATPALTQVMPPPPTTSSIESEDAGFSDLDTDASGDLSPSPLETGEGEGEGGERRLDGENKLSTKQRRPVEMGPISGRFGGSKPRIQEFVNPLVFKQTRPSVRRLASDAGISLDRVDFSVAANVPHIQYAGTGGTGCPTDFGVCLEVGKIVSDDAPAQGLLFDMRFVPRALTVAEIQQLYYEGKQYIDKLVGMLELILPQTDSAQLEIGTYSKETVAIMPSVLLQERSELSASCDFNDGVSPDLMMKYFEKRIEGKCSALYNCEFPVVGSTSGLVCVDRDKPDGATTWYNRMPVQFQGTEVFPQFLDLFTMSQVIVTRDGQKEFQKTSDWVDIQTNRLVLISFYYNAFKRMGTLMQIDWQFENKGSGQFKPLITLSSFIRMPPFWERRWRALVVVMFILVAGEVGLVGLSVWQRIRRRTALRKTILTARGTSELSNKERFILYESVPTLNPMDIVDFALRLWICIFLIEHCTRYPGALDAPFTNLLSLQWDDSSTSYAQKFTAFIDAVIKLQEAFDADSRHRAQGFILQLVYLIRLIVYLRVHPRIATLYKTIMVMGEDLIHFVLLFFICFFILGVAGSWSFGDYYPSFSGVHRTMLTQFKMLVGEMPWPEYDLFPTQFAIYCIVFYFVVTSLLLNFFLAIVVDSYAEVKEKILECNIGNTVFTDFTVALAYPLVRLSQKWPPRDLVLSAIICGRFGHGFQNDKGEDLLLVGVTDLVEKNIMPDQKSCLSWMRYYAKLCPRMVMRVDRGIQVQSQKSLGIAALECSKSAAHEMYIDRFLMESSSKGAHVGEVAQAPIVSDVLEDPDPAPNNDDDDEPPADIHHQSLEQVKAEIAGLHGKLDDLRSADEECRQRSTPNEDNAPASPSIEILGRLQEDIALLARLQQAWQNDKVEERRVMEELQLQVSASLDRRFSSPSSAHDRTKPYQPMGTYEPIQEATTIGHVPKPKSQKSPADTGTSLGPNGIAIEMQTQPSRDNKPFTNPFLRAFKAGPQKPMQ